MKFNFLRDVKIHLKDGSSYAFKKGERDVEKSVVSNKYFEDLVQARFIYPIGVISTKSETKADSKKA